MNEIYYTAVRFDRKLNIITMYQEAVTSYLISVPCPLVLLRRHVRLLQAQHLDHAEQLNAAHERPQDGHPEGEVDGATERRLPAAHRPAAPHAVPRVPESVRSSVQDELGIGSQDVRTRAERHPER